MNCTISKKTFHLGALLLCLLAVPSLQSLQASSMPEGDQVCCSELGPGKLAVSVTFPRAEEFKIVNRSEGKSLEADGYGYLSVPGKPMLPARKLLIALPPGARVQSVEIAGEGGKEVPGFFRIEPCPPIRLLNQHSGENSYLEKEWRTNKLLTYSSDEAFPRKRGMLKAKGTLRKYSYAAISVYPFSYHPLTGRLIHYDCAEAIIHFDRPKAGSPEALRIEDLLQDKKAERRAEKLFINYDSVKSLYEPRTVPAKRETYDFVILTALSLYDTVAATDFVEWKRSLGYKLVFVLVDDSKTGGQGSRDLAQDIRYYFRDHYSGWGMEYLLIVGDTATIPMRYCYPNAYWHDHNPSDPLNPGGSKPTDYYYADLSFIDGDSWDSDGDGFPGEYTHDNPDFMPEIYVGRIPTSDPARITYTMNKLVAFEQATGGWKEQAIHAGSILFFENDDHSGYPVVDSATFLSMIENDFMKDWRVCRFSEQAGLAPSEYDWPSLTEDAFSTKWRSKRYAVVNWGGHGCAWGVARTIWNWDDGDGVPENGNGEIGQDRMIDVSSLLDDDYPSIVFAVSCSVGYPEPNYGGNLGVQMLTDPNCGCASAVVSASRGAAAAAIWPEYLGGSQTIIYEFNHLMIKGQGGQGGQDGPECLGKALYDAKTYTHFNYGWDHVYEFQNMFVYNLYGDPTMYKVSATDPKGLKGAGKKDKLNTY